MKKALLISVMITLLGIPVSAQAVTGGLAAGQQQNSGSVVTVDNRAGGRTTIQGTSVSWTHTIAATSNLIYIGCSTANGHALTSVSVGASSASSVTTKADGNGSSLDSLWSLANPPTGSQTISVVLPSDFAQCESISVLGSNGTNATPVTAAGTNTTNPSVSVSSSLGDMVIDFLSVALSALCSAYTFTPGSGQASNWNQCVNTTNAAIGSVKGGGGSVTMAWTLSGTTPYYWAVIAVDVHHK